MSATQSSAVRTTSVPAAGSAEKPKPGIDGTTTSKASAATPPLASGSLSARTAGSISQNVPGQPWVITNGSGEAPRPA